MPTTMKQINQRVILKLRVRTPTGPVERELAIKQGYVGEFAGDERPDPAGPLVRVTRENLDTMAGLRPKVRDLAVELPSFGRTIRVGIPELVLDRGPDHFPRLIAEQVPEIAAKRRLLDAIEEIRRNPALRKRFVAALKER